MPTYDWLPRFMRDFEALGPQDEAAFRRALARFIEDLDSGHKPRPGLRVKGVRAAPGVFELTWAPDGRATFSYAKPIIPGQPHIIWRRIGSHEIFGTP